MAFTAIPGISLFAPVREDQQPGDGRGTIEIHHGMARGTRPLC